MISVRANVEVTLVLDSGSSWGSDCGAEQVRKQALEGAVGILRKAFPGTDLLPGHVLRSVKFGTVTAEISEDAK